MQLTEERNCFCYHNGLCTGTIQLKGEKQIIFPRRNGVVNVENSEMVPSGILAVMDDICALHDYIILLFCLELGADGWNVRNGRAPARVSGVCRPSLLYI